MPAALPELARLVAAGALRELVVDNYGAEMVADEADESTGLFVDALRASSLTTLQLGGVGHVCGVPAAVMAAAARINTRPH